MVRKVEPCRNVTVIEGTAWGDCGKGRASFFECRDADVVIRSTGGSNAGHTVVYNGKKYTLHLLPSGIIREEVKKSIISHGVVVNPDKLIDEMQKLQNDGVSITPDNLMVSGRAHVVFPFHMLQDNVNEMKRGANKIGTTGQGIGPTYADKADRIGIRMWDLLLPRKELSEKIEFVLSEHNKEFNSDSKFELNAVLDTVDQKWRRILEPYICNVSKYTDEIVGNPNYKILIEAAQGMWLDLELGDYPDVTSSYCNTSGTLSAAGIAPIYAKEVIGVAKPYNSRVGEGPFETELLDFVGNTIRNEGGEFGSTTGRSRRCGWLDLVRFKAASKRLGLTMINLNHLDTIGKVGKILTREYGVEKSIQLCHAYNYKGEIIEYLPEYDYRYSAVRPIPVYGEYAFSGWDIPKDCKKYDDLPKECQRFVETLEEILQVPIVYLGIGADNEKTIIRI